MANTITTPWGAASVVDRLTVQQRAGERRFASVVELLEHKGERLVRFAYTNDGSARRGPVTLRARDLEKLRGELAKHPEIAEALTSVLGSASPSSCVADRAGPGDLSRSRLRRSS